MDKVTRQATVTGVRNTQRWRAWLANLALFAVSTLVLLISFEVGIRLVAPQNSLFFDDSSFRRSAWEHIPGAVHESYIGVPVRINNLGFRGADITIPKPNGTYRIVGVGDSITFGYGVRIEETFLNVMEAGLNRHARQGVRYQVLNAAVTGTGLSYYSYFIRNTAPKFQPDMVLVCMAINDIYPYEPGADLAPPTPVRDSLNRRLFALLFHHSQLYAASYVKIKALLYGLGVLDINKLHGYDYLALEPPSPAQEKAWSATFGMLERIVKVAHEQHFKLGLVVFPMEQQLSPAILELYQRRLHLKIGPEALSGKPQQILRHFSERNGIIFVDLLPAFRAAAASGISPLFLRNVAVNYDPVHPSALGHRIAGEEILRSLKQSFRLM